MYKKLHKRLTLLFTGIAGAILIVMSLSYLYMSEKEFTENSFLTFSTQAASLLSNLEQQNSLTWEWLCKTSSSQNFLISLYDNGNPIAYTKTVLSESEQALTNEANAYAAEKYPALKNGSSYSAAHQEFSFISEQYGKFYASVFNIRKNQGILSGIILSSKMPLINQMKSQRIRFLAINIAGIIILLLFSYYFTGKLLHPIMEARQKQASFIAAASHELRTPIAVINSALSAAKSTEGENGKRFFHIVEEESLRLSRLTDDLLLLNRSDTGRLNLEKQPEELDTLLLNTYESFEPMAEQYRISLKIELPDEAAPLCVCDGERIRQVLGILISNALNYGRPGGYVKLSLSCSKSLFWIMVEDNGIGIAEKDKPYIFDRFYRADQSRSQKNHFGLGLSIAKEIIDAHGGKIMLKDAPNGGTRFFLFLK